MVLEVKRRVVLLCSLSRASKNAFCRVLQEKLGKISEKLAERAVAGKFSFHSIKFKEMGTSKRLLKPFKLLFMLEKKELAMESFFDDVKILKQLYSD